MKGIGLLIMKGIELLIRKGISFEGGSFLVLHPVLLKIAYFKSAH